MSILRLDMVAENTSDMNAESLSVDLLYFTKSRFENDRDFVVHSHPFTEVFLFTAGEGVVFHDHYRRNVKKGDVYIVNPNRLHTEKSVSLEGSGLEYYMVAIDNLVFKFSDAEKSELPPVFDFTEQYDILTAYFQRIELELTEKKPYFELCVNSATTSLIVSILRTVGASTIDAKNKSMTKECAFVKNYIDSHYNIPLNLSEIAKMAYISEGYLIRSFNKYFGMSPMAYLKEKRISEAKVVLKTTSFSISDIAENVGFGSASHFIQVFKKLTGQTPSHYRELNKNLTEKT